MIGAGAGGACAAVLSVGWVCGGCRSVCGAQCVAVVLVISRAGIGPKPEEVRANAGRKKGKKIVRVVLLFCMMDLKDPTLALGRWG